MRLSSLADYAVVMLTAAARRYAGMPCSAAVIAAETGVPLPTAQKLVSRLAAAGLVESARGTGGGFRLARPASTISLADIVEAVEGPIQLTSCVDGAALDCGLDHQCQVKPHWGVVNEAVRGALAGVSLASLALHPGEGAPRKVIISGDPEGRGPVAASDVTSRNANQITSPTWAPASAGVQLVGVEE